MAQPDNHHIFIFLPLALVVGKSICAAIDALVETFIGHRTVPPLIIIHLSLILLLHINYWWLAVQAGLLGKMHFDQYVRIAVVPLLLYSGTRILCGVRADNTATPATAAATIIAQLFPYYFLVLAFLALSFVQGVTLWTLPFTGPDQLVRVAAMLFVTIGLCTRSPRYHYCLAALLSALLLLFIAATW